MLAKTCASASRRKTPSPGSSTRPSPWAPRRPAEHAHLPPAVVEVVLARHREARGPEHPRDAVAEHGLAAVAEAQRARGVRRHELDLDALPLAEVARAEARTRLEDAAQHVVPARAAQPEAQEAGPRDLGALHEPVRVAELGLDPLRDLPGRAS